MSMGGFDVDLAESLLNDDTASVGGQQVNRSDFAYVGDPNDKSTWKLPIHDASHVRNALARYNQTDLPAAAKAAVYAKIKAAAKKFGIEVSDQHSEFRIMNYELTNLYSHELRVKLGASVLRDGKEFFEVPIAVTGAWVKGERKFSITAADLADMVRNFEKRKNDQVVIDYEHASEMPEVARGGPVPAAGWIHSLAANGILKALVEWTPDAKAMIEKGQYRFFSPAIDWGAKDKETGEPQGATLTSGALTNHPFLEELPAITLTDLDVDGAHAPIAQSCHRGATAALQEMAGVHQDGFMQDSTPMNRGATGGTMAKKVKLAKVAGFPGKRKVTADDGLDLGDFDLEDLEMDDGEVQTMMTKYGKTMRAPAGIGQGTPGAKMEDTLSEFFVETGVGSREEAVKLLKPAKQLGVERIESVTRSVAFSECLKDGAINLDVAAELADRGRLGMKDFRQIQKAQETVEKSIREGKFTPADREFISRLALSDTAKFEEWAKKKPPVVPLGGPTGVSGAVEPTTPDRELDLRVSELMREKKLDRIAALTELARTDPALIAKYRQAPQTN